MFRPLARAVFTHPLTRAHRIVDYSLVGASTSTDEEPNAMNMSQFLAFCKGAKFLQKRMTISDCDRLFLRATRAPAHTGEELKVSKARAILESHS